MPLSKRRVFISYHHGGDQYYYDALQKFACDQYDIFSDTSLDRVVQSTNHDYVMWSIAEKNIKGSSCTIVLVGPDTWGRKYVDWEIYETLDMSHGLVGILLPETPRASNGGTDKPKRLQDNLDSGYAVWLAWEDCTADNLKNAIERAVSKSADLINNDEALRQRNA